MAEGGDAHEALFEEEPADDGDGDAGQYVDDVVVERVDGRKPDAEADEGEERPEPPSAACLERVYEGYEHVCGVQRGKGCKDVGVARV